MLENFAHHLRQGGALRQLIVVALDPESVQYAKSLQGIGGVLAGSTVSGGSEDPVRVRYGVLVRCLKQGYHVLSSDLDVVWRRPPFAYFLNELDLQVQGNSRTGFRQEVPGGKVIENVVGGGLHYSVARRRVVEFWEGVMEKMDKEGASDADVSAQQESSSLVHVPSVSSQVGSKSRIFWFPGTSKFRIRR
jgi:hypothetical protein